jgi:hypothetical protein
MSRVRRIVRDIVAFGLMGLAVAYVVGWLGTAVEVQGQWLPWRSEQVVADVEGPVAVQTLRWRHRFFDAIQVMRTADAAQMKRWSAEAGTGPGWLPAGLYAPAWPEASDEVFLVAHGQGWPARSAMQWQMEPEPGGPLIRSGGYFRFGPLWLFWQPIWWGLAMNAAFYGSLLWLPWRGPRVVRRWGRRRRGACVRCGYDLRGTPASPGAGDARTPCPECGA